MLVTSLAASRLGENTCSIEAARKAVEIASWYAQAHAELGARLAEGGDFEAAFSAVSDAFFRHPTTALRVLRREPVFRRSPDCVDPYLANLGNRVREAVAGVLEIERFVREESLEDGESSALGEGPTEALHQLSGSGMLKLLSMARESVIRQVDLLKLRVDKMREDLERGWAAQAQAEAEIQALLERQTREAASLKAAKPRRSSWLEASALVLALLVAIWLKSPMTFVFLGALGVIGDLGYLANRRHRWRLDQVGLARRQRAQEEKLRQGVARIVEENSERHRLQVERYVAAIDRFEEATLRWAILSPTRGLGSAAPGDLLRLDGARPVDGYSLTLDSNPLPPSVREVVLPAEDSSGRYRLYRIQERQGSSIRAARWACYV